MFGIGGLEVFRVVSILYKNQVLKPPPQSNPSSLKIGSHKTRTACYVSRRLARLKAVTETAWHDGSSLSRSLASCYVLWQKSRNENIPPVGRGRGNCIQTAGTISCCTAERKLLAVQTPELAHPRPQRKKEVPPRAQI